MASIHTQAYSAHLREKAILVAERKILISHLSNSEQEKDLRSPINCQGFGRIRHFSLQKHRDWSPNPLPIVPAAKALGLPVEHMLPAQVFQNAACNWRCWYCFVDFALLAANPKYAQFLTPEALVEMYQQEPSAPRILDLSGGQPDIVPEWIIWTMEALEQRGLAGRIFLWSDDNLSSRYFWNYLRPTQRAYAAHFPGYARVGCFKGFDETSFAFNTKAAPECFNEQFEIYHDLLQEGFDMYAYVTFTSPPHPQIKYAMAQFVDRLQAIHRNLPLRTVPLKIEQFTPMLRRLKEAHQQALTFQYEAHAAWLEELSRRFSAEERAMAMCDVPMSL